MKENYLATEGKLLVRVIPKKEETAGGLLLAQPVNTDIHEGEVMSVGKYKKGVGQEFSIGDIVVWQNYSGVSLDIDGEPHLILNQSDIIATKSYN